MLDEALARPCESYASQVRHLRAPPALRAPSARDGDKKTARSASRAPHRSAGFGAGERAAARQQQKVQARQQGSQLCVAGAEKRPSKGRRNAMQVAQVGLRALMLAMPIVHLLQVQALQVRPSGAKHLQRALEGAPVRYVGAQTGQISSSEQLQHDGRRSGGADSMMALVRQWRRNSRPPRTSGADASEENNENKANKENELPSGKGAANDQFDDNQDQLAGTQPDSAGNKQLGGGGDNNNGPLALASGVTGASVATTQLGVSDNTGENGSGGGEPQAAPNGLEIPPDGDQEESDTISENGYELSGDPNNNNNTENQCDSLDDILASRPSRAVGLVFGLNYSIIFTFGLFGNVVTLYVLVCKGTSKCTVQDILIANLACSDIMLCLFAVPITPKYLILDGHWTLGSALCKVVSFAQSTSVYMSTYSLICIGYIRYRLIVHPLDESMSKRTALLSCLGTWVVGIVVTLPYMLQVRLSPDNCQIKFCDEAWEKPYRFIFSLFTAFFQFMIPLGSVGFFNKKIYSRLDGRGRRSGGDNCLPKQHKSNSGAAKKQQNGSQTSAPNLNLNSNSCASVMHSVIGPMGISVSSGASIEQQATCAHLCSAQNNDNNNNTPILNQRQLDVIAMKEQRQREKERRMRKANNRLIFVVVIFAHSWLPLNLFNIAQDYFEAVSQWPYLTNTFLIVHQVACSSVCWNPILYAWMSETYRQDLRCALPRCITRHFRCLADHHQHHHQQHSHTQLTHFQASREAHSTVSQRANHQHHLPPAGSLQTRRLAESCGLLQQAVALGEAAALARESRCTLADHRQLQHQFSKHHCTSTPGKLDELGASCESDNFPLSSPSTPVVQLCAASSSGCENVSESSA